MPSPKSQLKLTVVDSILKVPTAAWNDLNAGDFVFADHRFLASLEESGSLGRRTGWFPFFCLAWIEDRLVGALPLFAKNNSYGEFIFDWAWANAYRVSGLAYYPKLVSAIPFTPASGPKFLLAPGAGPEVREALLAHAESLLNATESSSLHFLFITPEEATFMDSEKYAVRHSFQYHWQNLGPKLGWASFDEFLGSLRSKRRSEIRRERAGAMSHSLRLETFHGDSVLPEHAELLFEFYKSTTGKMGGTAYLTAEFFRLVFERMKEHIVFMVAFRGNEPVAGALNFVKGATLYGRYWGCFEDYKNLHFELCYYRAIDWCLTNRVTKFEAGAQGEHKFNRGFRPELTLSAHRIENSELDHAIRNFIEEEKVGIRELFEDYKSHDPFQRTHLEGN